MTIMRAVRRVIFFGILCALLLIGRESSAATDASLRIITRNSETKFQRGELIPLDLSFTTGSTKRFSINMAQYDRSGRMRWETFAVNPSEGTTDPLAIYFNAFRGFLGGGLTNFQYLSAVPIQIHLQLNEWVRFDQPGTYRVSVSAGA
ncbi:MAG: hypothetical protein M3Y27_29850 [Acidobacteriota bacterium]|nr:hypothetical protein [Acidobacteriota bacterium]